MYGCESWTIKKTECQRIDAFELWCWRGLLRVPWISRRSNLEEINPEYSLEGPMEKLKLQYVGHLIWRADSLEKIQMLVKIEGWRQKEEGMTEEVREACMLHAMRAQRVGRNWVTEQQQKQMRAKKILFFVHCYFPAPWTVPGIY